MIHKNSILAFHEVEGMRNSLEFKMFLFLLLSKDSEIIAFRSCNIRELAESLGIDKSSSSARLNKLKKSQIKYQGKFYKLVLDKREKDLVTNCTVDFWKVELVNKQAELF